MISLSYCQFVSFLLLFSATFPPIFRSLSLFFLISVLLSLALISFSGPLFLSRPKLVAATGRGFSIIAAALETHTNRQSSSKSNHRNTKVARSTVDRELRQSTGQNGAPSNHDLATGEKTQAFLLWTVKHFSAKTSLCLALSNRKVDAIKECAHFVSPLDSLTMLFIQLFVSLF